MKQPQLSEEQIEQLNNLIEFTILPALCEDGACDPDMSDMTTEDPNYDEAWEERSNALYVQAIQYLKNNL